MDLDRYIGQHWDAIEANCWDLVRRVYADCGVTLPVMQVDAANVRQVLTTLRDPVSYQLWQAVEQPQLLDVVVLRQGKTPCHVGIYTRLGILHGIKTSGVILSNNKHLNLLGFAVHSAWRYTQWPS